jgi:hypothetical protein
VQVMLLVMIAVFFLWGVLRFGTCGVKKPKNKKGGESAEKRQKWTIFLIGTGVVFLR